MAEASGSGQKQGRALQEERLFGGERARHLAFTKRLGAVLASVCAAAIAIWVLDPDVMVYYVKPGVTAGGERVCLVYQRRSPLRRRTYSFFVFAEGDGWGRKNRLFGEYSGAVQRGEELLLFFGGETYASYRGEEWEKARDWAPGWTVMGGERVAGMLWVAGADRSLRAAVWEDSEWKESGEGPAVAGRVKDLALVSRGNDELWAAWSDEEGQWFSRIAPSWGERMRLMVPDAVRLGATTARTEGRFWVFYAAKDKKALQWAEVDEEGEVVRNGDMGQKLSTQGRVSGVTALKKGEKAWVLVTGFGGVKRFYFDGESWEDGGWIERAGLARKLARSLWAVVFTLMPVLTVIMAGAVFRMQEAFANALMGVREGYVGSWWKRGVAQLLDGLLYAPMCAGMWGLLGGWKLWQVGLSGLGLLALYFVVCEGVWGRTLGKAALGLSVVRENGGKAGLGPAAVRNLARLIDFLPLGYAVGIVVSQKGKLRQRIGDRAARTVVVNRAGLERRLERTA